MCCDEGKGYLLEKVHVKWFHEHHTDVNWSSFSSLFTSVLCTGGKQFLSAHVYQRLLPLIAFSVDTNIKGWVCSLEAVPAYVFTYWGCEKFSKSNT